MKVMVKKALKVCELDKTEKMLEYQEKIRREWNEVRERETAYVVEEWQLFKSAVATSAENLCVYEGPCVL